MSIVGKTLGVLATLGAAAVVAVGTALWGVNEVIESNPKNAKDFGKDVGAVVVDKGEKAARVLGNFGLGALEGGVDQAAKNHPDAAAVVGAAASAARGIADAAKNTRVPAFDTASGKRAQVPTPPPMPTGERGDVEGPTVGSITPVDKTMCRRIDAGAYVWNDKRGNVVGYVRREDGSCIEVTPLPEPAN